MLDYIPAFEFDGSQQDYHEGVPFISQLSLHQLRSDLPHAEAVTRILEHYQSPPPDVDLEHPYHAICRHTLDLVEHGGAVSRCLCCQKPLVSRETYPVFITGFAPPILHRFKCCKEHYLITGFHPPNLVGLFVPDEHLVLSFFNHDHPVVRRDWGQTALLRYVHVLYALISRRMDLVAAYRAGAANNRLCFATACTNNVSHQIREELPVLHKLLLADDAPAPHLETVVGPYDFLDLQHHLGQRVIHRVAARNIQELALEMFDLCMRRHLTLVRPGCAGQMPDALSDHLIAHARKTEGEISARLARALGDHAPVLWVTLRSHSRVWVNQEQGLAQVISAVHEVHPDLAVVFDGLDREAQVLEQILALLPDPPVYFNGLGTNIYQALALFEAADAFLMPYSNSAFTAMAIPRPGVFYGLTGWFPEEPFPMVRRREEVLAYPVTGPPCRVESQRGALSPTTLDFDVDVQELTRTVLQVLG